MSLRTVYSEKNKLTLDVKTENSGQRVVIGFIPPEVWTNIIDEILKEPSMDEGSAGSAFSTTWTLATVGVTLGAISYSFEWLWFHEL